MNTFLRLSRYFLQYKWRIVAGLVSVAIMSLPDTTSAFLVASLFAVLQQIEGFVKSGADLVMDVPITLSPLHIDLYTMSINGYNESFRLIVFFAIAILVIVIVKVTFVYVRE